MYCAIVTPVCITRTRLTYLPGLVGPVWVGSRPDLKSDFSYTRRVICTASALPRRLCAEKSLASNLPTRGKIAIPIPL
jgi:hypothetical protein